MPPTGAAGDVLVKAIRKPSVVLFIADDLSYHDIGAYGSRDAKTPSIDALSREGLIFRNAYTATAMCSPTRQMLYSGAPRLPQAFPEGE